MIIKGFQKTSLVDFPGMVASTVFVAGCNFRCHFCHNPSLVFDDSSLKRIPEEEVLAEIGKRRGFIDGVCVSGGEPTIYDDLPRFLAKIKSLGLKVKLDTNGSNPGMLKQVISGGIVDYVAMDIKSSLGSYSKVVCASVDTNKVMGSINVLLNCNVDYEFRTTVVPGLFGMEQLRSICKEITGAKRYFIQQFKSTTPLVDSRYSELKPFSDEELGQFASFARQFVQDCEVRNT